MYLFITGSNCFSVLVFGCNWFTIFNILYLLYIYLVYLVISILVLFIYATADSLSNTLVRTELAG